KLLLQKRIPEQIPTQVSNACRAFARQVLELLEIDLGEEEADSPMQTAETLDEDERPMRLRG
ncbi:MAG: hypothetical protein IJS87_00040, partial [Rhodocyclaceae bacterium]|nr:hypothetical protein [Rhodocyclaceae bacterium]